MKNLVLKNDFHNSEVTLRVNHAGEIEVDDVIKLSAGQVKKAQNTLCGIDGCLCSGELGTRAGWHQLGDQEVKLSENVEYDRNGKIIGASLYIEKIW